MLDQGNFLWNGGIFLFTARTILAAAEAHAPDLLAPCRAAAAEASTDLGFLRLAPAPWARAEEISIDYAVMEKADNLVVVPFQGRWSDLGDWAAVWRDIGLAGGADSSGVVRHGPSTGIDCHDSLLRSEVEGLELVGIGLSNIIAVAMPDAVLVADRSRAQDVKLAVAALKKRNARQAETFPLDHRPWGWFETLAISGRFQVKRIVVNPGASLSLQSHMHRSEHWIVVAGTAKVSIDGEQRLISENQSVYIPLGARHRLENPGLVPMILIEVQTGAYLGEDDITRYEDIYARGQGAKG
jgi:mannose-1-phosphate guanylyltransferase/mannose-6-phosphate isomerase